MFAHLSRREFILHAIAGAGGGLAAGTVCAQPGTGRPPSTDSLRLGAAWRVAENGRAVDHVGVLAVDWAAAQVRIVASQALPERAHGLLAEAGGGLLVVAARPGRWLMRLDGEG